ncbi:hypothetical protein MNBD_GAMMA12-628 [hydrothermal vent metagenome]|uniref:Secreted protein n=1 Tax=hydrothermal vent metagenome TaxID=652676 RepID=A0A3B0Z3Q9_9ZZZZ
MKHGTLGQRLRYRFDNFISKGGWSIFISLLAVFITSLIIIFSIRATIFYVYPEASKEFDTLLRNLYISFLELTDPGSMAQDKDSSGWFKLTAIMAGISGIVIMSMLIAIITTALDQKLAFLRKGHSKVMEQNHTLILGWNDRVIEIIRELILANESERSPAVVILSDLEKEYMDDILNTQLKNRLSTRIITRSGNTASVTDLARVSIESCRSVIAVAHCSDTASTDKKDASDARVIKTVLGIITSKPTDKQYNIVTEIFELRNRAVIESISPTEVITVDTQDILAKLLAQTSRSSGLAIVYGEILSFDGCEMYFYTSHWKESKFGDLQYHFEDGVPIGIRTNNKVTINPDANTIMKAGDDILIVAEDDSTIRFQKNSVTQVKPLKLKPGRLNIQQERTLLLGWNAKARVFIEQLADYVKQNSVVDIVIKHPAPAIINTIKELQARLSHITINLYNHDPMLRETLLEHDPFSYNDIIILSQGDEISNPEKTDSETIIILLLLRAIFAENPKKARRTKLITEVLNSENKELISQTGVNDFIISNRFISNILAQISEEPDIKAVYDDLFEEDGSEIYLKPLSLYLKKLPNKAVKFSDLMHLAQQRNEICIGFRSHKDIDNISKNFGVKMIPNKNKTYLLHPDDNLVVVAADEL